MSSEPTGKTYIARTRAGAYDMSNYKASSYCATGSNIGSGLWVVQGLNNAQSEISQNCALPDMEGSSLKYLEDTYKDAGLSLPARKNGELIFLGVTNNPGGETFKDEDLKAPYGTNNDYFEEGTACSVIQDGRVCVLLATDIAIDNTTYAYSDDEVGIVTDGTTGAVIGSIGLVADLTTAGHNHVKFSDTGNLNFTVIRGGLAGEFAVIDLDRLG